MNTLKERINKEYIIAFKDRENGKVKKTLLSLVKGSIQNEEGRGTESTDENVLKTLKSIRKGLVEGVERNVEGAQNELDIINSYFPTLMSENDVKTIVENLINDGANNIGMVMKEFNTNHKGKADNNIVKKVALELFK